MEAAATPLLAHGSEATAGPEADPDAVTLVGECPNLLERCGVCRGRLREHQPRLLPCLHSVCKGCLNVGASPQVEGMICCPVCKQQCYMKDIIENYFLRDTGDLDTDSNKKVCTSCEDNAVSSSFCVECAEWLCDACVEAHQRVKFTKDHTMSKKNPGLTADGRANCERPIFCSIHRQETLKLFCETCDTLTCRDCQLLTHKDHRYQFLEEAIKNQKMTLENLVKRLTEKKTQLQVTTKQVRTRLRDVQDMQKKVQVEIKMAILQIMRELNKRGKTLIQRVEKLAEEQQLKLEQQHLSMSKLYRQMDHVLKFASWAVNTDNSIALLLCKKLIFYQLQRGLQSKVNTEELKNDIIAFLWDSAFWTKNAANFGNVVIEIPPTLSTHLPVQHQSISGHCPQPVPQHQAIPQLQPVSQHHPNNRMIATQGNSWRSHVPGVQSSHRLPPPSYQQTTLPPPRQLPPQQNTQQAFICQPHSWPPVSGHSRLQQAAQLGKPTTTMPSANGRYLQQMEVQVVQQGNIVQIQQQQQQQMGPVLFLPQMNGIQVHQPQGPTQGAVKQSINTLYQQQSAPQPTAISKHQSFGPNADRSIQSPPVQQISTSTELLNAPVSRPSPPVHQVLRSNTATSRQLLTTAVSQQVHPTFPAVGQSTQVGANCHRSPTSSHRLGNSPVDQLKMLVQQATSYPRVILPHRDVLANAHDFAQKQLSNASHTTELEGQRNSIKELQEASESGCNTLQCTLTHAGGSSDSNIKPKLNLKVPYVRLERLQIDLSTDTELPTFKLLPGTGQDEFSLIIIEGEGLPLNPSFTAPQIEETAIRAVPDVNSVLVPATLTTASGLISPQSVHLGASQFGGQQPPLKKTAEPTSLTKDKGGKTQHPTPTNQFSAATMSACPASDLSATNEPAADVDIYPLHKSSSAKPSQRLTRTCIRLKVKSKPQKSVDTVVEVKTQNAGEAQQVKQAKQAPTLESTLTPPNSVSPASVTEIEFVFNGRTEVTSKRSHHALSPTPSPSEKSPGSIPDLKASPLCSVSEKGEELDEMMCVVCGKGGEVLCCRHCLKAFHVSCHVPALPSVPSLQWATLLSRMLSVLGLWLQTGLWAAASILPPPLEVDDIERLRGCRYFPRCAAVTGATRLRVVIEALVFQRGGWTDISVEWTCSLCVDLTAPEPQSESSSTLSNDRTATEEGLGAVDQRKCERLLLMLLSHKMSQALRYPSGSSQVQSQQLDLSSMRAKLEKTSTTHYSSPDEFVFEARLMFKAFGKLRQERKEVVESVLALESFFEEKLVDVFSGQNFDSVPSEQQVLETGNKHCDQTHWKGAACPADDADSSLVQAKRRRLDSD